MWGQPGDRRAQMGFRGVPELDDQRVTIECRLHDASEDAGATPMDQTNLVKPGMTGGRDVLVDERSDIRGRERVQIERAVDGNADGLFGVAHGFL